MPKRYDPEDKRLAVHLILSGAVRAPEVARALGCSPQAVEQWLPKGVDLKQAREKWVTNYINAIRELANGK